jgi:hypothetical protein
MFCRVLHVLEYVSLFSFTQMPKETQQLSATKFHALHQNWSLHTEIFPLFPFHGFDCPQFL